MTKPLEQLRSELNNWLSDLDYLEWRRGEILANDPEPLNVPNSLDSRIDYTNVKIYDVSRQIEWLDSKSTDPIKPLTRQEMMDIRVLSHWYTPLEGRSYYLKENGKEIAYIDSECKYKLWGKYEPKGQ